MTAFSEAMVRIFRDPNMAADALWMAGGVPPAIPVRVIRKAPDEVTNFGQSRVFSESVMIDVLIAVLPNPERGDRVVIDGETFEVQGEPIRDSERLIWKMDLRPA